MAAIEKTPAVFQQSIDSIIATTPERTVWGIYAMGTHETLAEFNPDLSFYAASIGKLAIAYAVDIESATAPNIWDHPLVLQSQHREGGSGLLQYRPEGFRLNVKEAAYFMLAESDNIAANLIVEQLGGFEAVNKTLDKSLLDIPTSRLRSNSEYGYDYGFTTAREAVTLLDTLLDKDRSPHITEALHRSHAWYGLRGDIETLARPLPLKGRWQRRLSRVLKQRQRTLPNWAAGLGRGNIRRRSPYANKEGSTESGLRHDVAQIGEITIAALSSGYPEKDVYGFNHPAHAIHRQIGRLVLDFQK